MLAIVQVGSRSKPQRRIDTDHPAAIRYLRDKGIEPPKKTPDQKEEVIDLKKNGNVYEVPKEMASIANFTVREVVTRFGSDFKFLEWLKALKMIEEVVEKNHNNAVREGKLIEREFVRNHVIGMIEALHQRLLTDFPRVLVAKLVEAHEAGHRATQLEDLATMQLKEELGSVKQDAAGAITGA